MKKIKQAINWLIKIIVKGAIFIFLKVVYRAKAIGTKNIPKEGPVIFCGNHRSYLDPPLILATGKRDMKFLAKQELFENKFLAFLGKVFEAIPVKRDEKDFAAIKTTLKDLKQGKCITLFPEGTRNGIKKGERIKDGVAFFAIQSGAKVVPCGIKGGEKGNRRMVITYGEPMEYGQYKSQIKDKEVLEKVTKEIMDKILELAK